MDWWKALRGIVPCSRNEDVGLLTKKRAAGGTRGLGGISYADATTMRMRGTVAGFGRAVEDEIVTELGVGVLRGRWSRVGEMALSCVLRQQKKLALKVKAKHKMVF